MEDGDDIDATLMQVRNLDLFACMSLPKPYTSKEDIFPDHDLDHLAGRWVSLGWYASVPISFARYLNFASDISCAITFNFPSRIARHVTYATLEPY